MFADPEAFTAGHRQCGDFTDEVGGTTAEGYHLAVRCACGDTFERWISPEVAAQDLIGSRLLTSVK